MKRIIFLLSILFCSGAYADTINLHWLNDNGTTYTESTCTVDDDLIIPTTPPTKYGYTFTGWKMHPFVQIEYLESTGTQWIDTKINPTAFTYVKLTGKFNAFDTSSHPTLAGFADGNFLGRFYVFQQTGGMFRYTYGINDTKSDTCDTAIHTIDFNTPNTHKILVDNIEKTTLSIQDFSTTNVNGMHLFNSYSGVNDTNVSTPVKGRIYSAKIYDNDVLVRDFIPVLDFNGTPCMYDKVEGKFYYNAGTGQFVAGPVIGGE